MDGRGERKGKGLEYRVPFMDPIDTPLAYT